MIASVCGVSKARESREPGAALASEAAGRDGGEVYSPPFYDIAGGMNADRQPTMQQKADLPARRPGR